MKNRNLFKLANKSPKQILSGSLANFVLFSLYNVVLLRSTLCFLTLSFTILANVGLYISQDTQRLTRFRLGWSKILEISSLWNTDHICYSFVSGEQSTLAAHVTIGKTKRNAKKVLSILGKKQTGSILRIDIRPLTPFFFFGKMSIH